MHHPAEASSMLQSLLVTLTCKEGSHTCCRRWSIGHGQQEGPTVGGTVRHVGHGVSSPYYYTLLHFSPSLPFPFSSPRSISPVLDSPRKEERERRRFMPVEMSSRRSSRISDEEISELISKLQSLLPESRRRSMSRASAAKLLKETCSYIKSLHREVDDLSDRLSDLMSTMDDGSPQAEIIRSILRS
ncbi:hypothetical protein C4D60_Mb07t17710 [Musa balbisiana]|uniref:BHLH domain-containing protein n=1 Tax=Musa balbisiana TaxID=52838 RepID=A0A4S8JGB1_MUSBA|nr:hypothetical protein C4D60_Mb07t17710 [Musa balbisiana]